MNVRPRYSNRQLLPANETIYEEISILTETGGQRWDGNQDTPSVAEYSPFVGNYPRVPRETNSFARFLDEHLQYSLLTVHIDSKEVHGV